MMGMRTVVAGVVGAGLVFATLPALAQQTGQGGAAPAQQQSPAPQVDVGEKELSQFASAVVAIQQVKKSYSEEIGQAGDKEKAQKLQGEMQTAMREAIEKEGLSVERYAKIGEAIQGDEELKKRVTKEIKETQ